MAKVLKFPCGLRVCYERVRKAGSCAFGVFVNVGSGDEGPDNNGVAHFIEHMLFKGTERRTAFEIANETDLLGANSNAYTSKSNTVFYMYGLAEFLPQYMDILSDMYFHSTFTDENIEKERGVVLEEIKMYDDDGESLCSDLLSLHFFGRKPFARPILGTAATVKKLNAEKIRAFMAKNYVPQKTVLSYVGPASEEELRALVQTYFADEFAKKEYGTVKKSVRKIKTHPTYRTRTDKPFEQANVLIRFPAYTVRDDRAEACLTMAQILGGGMSSRLFQKVREENGYVYEVYASSAALAGTGYVDIGFATTPELAEKAVFAVRETLEEAKKNGFTEEEFVKIKHQREAGAVLGAETTFDRMRLMGKYMCLTGKLMTYEKLAKKMEKITLEDVNAACREVFDYEKMAVCYVGKEIGSDLSASLKTGG